jgi:hypothetical protein
VQVDLILCSSITEAQSRKQLGFPDATIVPTDFGVYMVDDAQKIQLIFIGNCRDETTSFYKLQESSIGLKKVVKWERLEERRKLGGGFQCDS